MAENRRNFRLLLTLRPERFAELGQSAYDISGYLRALYATPGLLNDKLTTTLWYDWKERFPPNTKGYLYFYRNKEKKPPFDIEVRMRICDHYSDFQDGYDLRHPCHDWEPWSVSLHQIALNSKNSAAHYSSLAFRHLLVKEMMVDDALLSDIGQHEHQHSRFVHVLYDMEEPFVLHPNARVNVVMAFVTRHAYTKFNLGRVFGESRVNGKYQFAYNGKLLSKVDFLRRLTS